MRASFKDKRTNEIIRYCDLDEMKERHPNGNYIVIGETNIRKSFEGTGIAKVSEDKVEVHFFPIGKFKEAKYRTIGYIPCNEGEYIVVKKRKVMKYVLFALIPLLLILLIVGFFLLNKHFINKPDIDPNAGDYDSQLKRPENIGESKILIPGYGKFTLQKGSKTINTVLFNPEDNPCFFQFTLVEKDTDEVLYESKLVPPGKGITPIEIKKSYSNLGTYKAVLKFKTVDFEDTSINYNGSDIEVDINVVE